jgi:hypothetical protein
MGSLKRIRNVKVAVTSIMNFSDRRCDQFRKPPPQEKVPPGTHSTVLGPQNRYDGGAEPLSLPRIELRQSRLVSHFNGRITRNSNHKHNEV